MLLLLDLPKLLDTAKKVNLKCVFLEFIIKVV